MADDDGAAGKIFERFFERTHRVDVEIVGRLVEQNDVGTGFQHFRQMNAVAFAARKLADEFLLIGAREIELRNVGPGVHLAFAERDEIEPVGDLVEDRFVGVQAESRD